MIKNYDFKLVNDNGVKYYIANELDRYGVNHMFTTKIGGYSLGDYSSMNLGINTDDNIDDIIKNYEKICKCLNVSQDNIYMTKQVHSDNIIDINDSNKSRMKFALLREQGVDGLITAVKDATLFCYGADCVTILFYDKVKNVAGVAHAGWKGTVKEITSKMIDMFVSNYDSKLDDIIVALGPSIGPCCFEVKKDVYDEFYKIFGEKIILHNIAQKINEEQWRIDLWQANRVLLLEKGIKDLNIKTSMLCTFCNDDLFYSYRRDGGVTGRLAAIIKTGGNSRA